jgi:hypothetical protein
MAGASEMQTISRTSISISHWVEALQAVAPDALVFGNSANASEMLPISKRKISVSHLVMVLLHAVVSAASAHQKTGSAGERYQLQ